MKEHFGCPVGATVNVIAGKWKVQIVWHLAIAPQRFAALRRLLPNVSEKVLTAQLRELERDGVVARNATDTPLPQTTYRLTDAGEALIPAMELMCNWGTTYLGVASTLPARPAARATSA